jgi:NtrC-family two-component system response regulator AlgB
MQRAYDILYKAATSPAGILLLGESGTGKTVIARVVHERSPQRDNSFVTISCPSLSRELLESDLFGHVKGAFTGALTNTWGKVAQADGGTLFLDEIGEMPMEIQPKLLRLLQEKEYERVGETKTQRANVRVIAATNRDLSKAVQEGRFREDLFYRLNVIGVQLPALRERTGDLMNIARSYLRFFDVQCAKHLAGFTVRAESAMMRYRWPGNLRELRNAVERAVILATGNEIDLEDLPDSLREHSGQPSDEGARVEAMMSLEEIAEEHIRRVLARTRSLGEAARILGIDQATLFRKRRKLAL